MFDFSWGELLLIGAVALIVIGPKELPAVLRAVGQWTTKIRRMAGEFQSQFQEAMREAEMTDLKREVDSLNESAKGFSSSLATQFDPLDLNEGSKWQPKPDLDPASNIDGGTKPADALAETHVTPQAVTADGYSADLSGDAATPPAAEAEPGLGVPAEDSPGAPVLSPAAAPPGDRSPVASDPAVPEGGGRA